MKTIGLIGGMSWESTRIYYPTNPVYFDTYGMTWRLGVKATF